jgi:hypothetical protein
MKNSIKNFMISERVFIALVMLLTAILGLFRINDKSFWFDETFTVFVTQQAGLMFNILWNHEANMWFYYILMFGWQKLSMSEFWIRSFSVIFSVLAILVFYLLGKKLFNSRVSAIATLLLPFNFLFIFNSQNGRSYSLVLFLTLLASILFLKFIEQSTSRNKYFFSIVSILAIYTHVFAGFLVIGQIIYLFLLKRMAGYKAILSIGIIHAIGLLPFLISPAFRGDQVGWLEKPDFLAPIGVFSLLAGDFFPLMVGYGCLLLIGCYYIIKEKLNNALKYCLLLAITPLVLALIISFLIKPIYQSIYLFVSLPYFLLLMGFVLTKIRSNLIRVVAIAGLILFACFRLYGWRKRKDQKEGR